MMEEFNVTSHYRTSTGDFIKEDWQLGQNQLSVDSFIDGLDGFYPDLKISIDDNKLSIYNASELFEIHTIDGANWIESSV